MHPLHISSIYINFSERWTTNHWTEPEAWAHEVTMMADVHLFQRDGQNQERGAQDQQYDLM